VSRPPALDLRVTIDRVHVRTAAPGDTRPRPTFVSGYLGGGAGAPLHDHRIVIHELRIDVEAVLDAAAARSLGSQVASELAGQLAELQDRRAARIHKSASCRPIYIETLYLHLRGEPARHPATRQISAALMNAFDERVCDAS